MAANALKKIQSLAKAYKKKHPNAKHKSAMKAAGAAYRAQKNKPKRRKAAPVKKKARKRSVVRKRKTVRKSPRKRRASVRRVVVVRRAAPKKRRRAKPRKKAVTRRRRVGGGGGIKMKQLLLIGGIGLAAYLLIFRRPQSNVVYIPTSNMDRNNKAQQILSMAQAAGLAATQIAALIAAMNTRTDSQINDMYNAAQGGSYMLA